MEKIKCNYLLIILSFFAIPNALAANRIVNLVVGYKTVNFSDKEKQAIAVNHQIPAPTLHFKEGDRVTINVTNQLDQGTSIHWHGLLVPWQMDGVEGVSQKAIPPGGVFSYQFTLKQSGTYWYHAHAGFQEQQGLYGGIIIDPLKPPHYKYTKDYVIVLSDWNNTAPEKIFANLKKEGDYYLSRFPLQASLVKFMYDYQKATPEKRKMLIDDYKMMQHMRMSIYDFSDVAYNVFLLNGQPSDHPWTAPVKIGDTVRLRFIGAGGSTIFRVKIPDIKMKMVHVQGNDIKPYSVDDFTIAPGETYDVLIKIQKNSPYIIYAESTDTLGAAWGALVTDPKEKVDYKKVPPFPEPLPVTMGHSKMPAMDHDSMNMNIKPGKAIENNKTSQYQALAAFVKTNDPHKPIQQTIQMDLFGFMDPYIWFINGVPEYQAKPIIIEPEKRYRIIFTNNSMMHHPMHIHGHWFILRNGQGAYDPLLHTIDVAPGATAVVDFDTDASGQWFFHCHHLYHMMAGMARIFQYNTIIDIANGKAKPEKEDITMPLDRSLITHPMAHAPSFYFSSFLDLGEDPFHNVQKVTFKGLYGQDYHKLELYTEDTEVKKGKVENADLDIFYWHLIDQFWSIKGGVNYYYRPAQTLYWQPGIGIEGLMPYFIDTNARAYYHKGSIKLDIELSRDSQITRNFFIRAGLRSILATKTNVIDEIGSGLNQMRYIVRPYYRLIPGLAVFVEFEHEQSYGILKNIRRNLRESIREDTLTFGFSILF